MKAILSALATLLVLSALTRAEDPTTVTRHADRIDFTIGGQLVTTYRIGANVAKPYFYPFNGPGGVSVTRAWPIEQGRPDEVTKDHPHQKSAWFCHGDVIPEGMELKRKGRDVDGVDFWAESAPHGVIACVGVDRANANGVVTRNEWRAADGQKVLDEVRTVSCRACANGYLLAVRSELIASAWPVTFGDTKEGSFGVRVNDQLRVGDRNVRNPKSVIRNAAGKTGEKDCWGYMSDWCDYSGEVDGKAVGIAVFADPTNKYPSCWHVRDYGLLAANPFGRSKAGFPAMKGRTDLVQIAKGDHLTFRFGIYVHPGDASAGQVAEAFKQFTARRD
jgi:Methane oxygenase PmoA